MADRGVFGIPHGIMSSDDEQAALLFAGAAFAFGMAIDKPIVGIGLAVVISVVGEALIDFERST